MSEIARHNPGRRMSIDIRDSMHMIRGAVKLPPIGKIPDRKHHYSRIWRGNQGSTSSCVGFSLAHLLHMGPITQYVKGMTLPIVDPFNDVYLPAQRDDEWPGENYDGTSVRAGLKILQKLGFITAYKWTWDFDEMLLALSMCPVVFGINWYEMMWYPSKTGLVRIGGPLRGGHAITACGYSFASEEVTFLQSYGPTHGQNGMIRMKFSDVRRLMAEDGECALVTEKLRPSQLKVAPAPSPIEDTLGPA